MPSTPPQLSTPGPTAQFLVILTVSSGLALMLVSVLLALFHPLPGTQQELLTAGLALAGISSGVYGVLTTGLKWAAIARRYEPEVDAMAAVIPGKLGVDARLVLSLLEKVLNALPDPSAPPASPVAQAAAAGVQAAATPAKTL